MLWLLDIISITVIIIILISIISIISIITIITIITIIVVAITIIMAMLSSFYGCYGNVYHPKLDWWQDQATMGSQPVSLFALSQHLGTTEDMGSQTAVWGTTGTHGCHKVWDGFRRAKAS